MKDMRKQMAENEDLDVLMSGLRGTNIDQSDFAEQGVEMKVIDFDKYDEGTNEDKLPLVYDPEAIERYWSKRSAPSYKEHFNSSQSVEVLSAG